MDVAASPLGIEGNSEAHRQGRRRRGRPVPEHEREPPTLLRQRCRTASDPARHPPAATADRRPE